MFDRYVLLGSQISGRYFRSVTVQETLRTTEMQYCTTVTKLEEDGVLKLVTVTIGRLASQ